MICVCCRTHENDLCDTYEPVSVVSKYLRDEIKENIVVVRVSRKRIICVEEEVVALSAALSENAERERSRVSTVFQEVDCFVFYNN